MARQIAAALLRAILSRPAADNSDEQMNCFDRIGAESWAKTWTLLIVATPF